MDRARNAASAAAKSKPALAAEEKRREIRGAAEAGSPALRVRHLREPRDEGAGEVSGTPSSSGRDGSRFKSTRVTCGEAGRPLGRQAQQAQGRPSGPPGTPRGTEWRAEEERGAGRERANRRHVARVVTAADSSPLRSCKEPFVLLIHDEEARVGDRSEAPPTAARSRRAPPARTRSHSRARSRSDWAECRPPPVSELAAKLPRERRERNLRHERHGAAPPRASRRSARR